MRRGTFTDRVGFPTGYYIPPEPPGPGGDVSLRTLLMCLALYLLVGGTLLNWVNNRPAPEPPLAAPAANPFRPQPAAPTPPAGPRRETLAEFVAKANRPQ